MSTPSVTRIETPQTRCLAAVARCDITPPVGIYHRMWGAATHDRATGVHRPLLATMLWLEPEAGDFGKALVVIALDHCILDGDDIALMEKAVADAAKVQPEQVLVALAHTHAAGLMSRSRSHLPGGELIGPYLDCVASKLGDLAAQITSARQPATIVYGQGRCSLAANRDFFDPERQQTVCGFNPEGLADDTLLVAKIVAADGGVLATVVNYACHPTTLAWQNTLISPDYVGALRETIEHQTRAPCVFLQGASADLGPHEGFVGDTAVADRNGRELAFAALAALEGLPHPGTFFAYAGPVVSGATIGIWQHQRDDASAAKQSADWRVARCNTPLDYRADLPSIDQTQSDLERWQREEAAAAAAGQGERAQVCRARAEQATRQLWRLEALPPGSFRLRATLAHLGKAFWVFVAGEHYQTLQTELRRRFPHQPIIVTTLTSGWQPGYIPPAELFGRGIYQEQIAVVAPGSAERLIEEIGAQMRELTE